MMTDKAKQVFISHAKEDADFAHRLADDLNRLGVRVWIAPESILPGEGWVKAIERGLRESSHVVIVLTPAALESQWVEKETDVAIAQERKGLIKILPLDVKACDVPLLLSSYQMIPFRRGYDVGLSQLTNTLDLRVMSPAPHQSPKPVPVPEVLSPTVVDGEHLSLPDGIFPRSDRVFLGKGPSCIHHMPWPCILPICFKDPKESKYVYVIVGNNGHAQENLISFEPTSPRPNIYSNQQHGTSWYQLTSNESLKSVTFGNEQPITDFTTIPTEFHRLGTWNTSGIITVPDDRPRAYALGITEQLGPSVWYVSVDDHEFAFDQIEGCHFVELSLQTGTEHKLSLGYKGGGFGIECAFFAF